MAWDKHPADEHSSLLTARRLRTFVTMAAGREPNRTIVITGALGLNAVCDRQGGGTLLKEATDMVTGLATGGAFDIYDGNRRQFAHYAEAVRAEASRLRPDENRIR